MKQENEKYCQECAAVINVKAEICPSCGVRQVGITTETSVKPSTDNSRWLTCLLLCWLAGPFGVHRFYTGHIAIGVIQLLTFGGCGIWSLIDLIIIISGNFKDSEGNLIKSA
jgi:TM2 domain-containing membrane protein YozV